MRNDISLSELPEAEALPVRLAARLWVVLGGLRAAIATWGGRDRAAVPLVVLVYGRIGRLAQRFKALMARLQAGILPPARVRVRSRAGIADTAVRLPRGFGWLSKALPESRGYAGQLQTLLAEPEVAALLAGCPQAERIVGPLRRMLGIAAPGAPVRDPKPYRAKRSGVDWWQAAAGVAPVAPEVSGERFPSGRPPPSWSG